MAGRSMGILRRDAEARREAEGKGRAQGLETGWTITSYLIGGMIAYGGIGWLIGRAVHIWMLFPIGMLVGLAISLSYIIFRYGKQQAPPSKPQLSKPQLSKQGAASRPPRKEMTGDR
jgi:ATP synthase protein I